MKSCAPGESKVAAALLCSTYLGLIRRRDVKDHVHEHM